MGNTLHFYPQGSKNLKEIGNDIIVLLKDSENDFSVQDFEQWKRKLQ